MLELKMKLKNDTKTCYRFESRNKQSFTTLYLKKTDVEAAGIDPKKGVTVTVEEGNEDA